jgi:(2R)-sulfolactate sulfo-lyase subunit alpha
MAATTHFIVHDKTDTVGVVVVENVKAGETLTGWVLEDDSTIKVKALDAVPLGHKIALTDIKKGDTVLKYGHDIGRATAAIGQGKHAHIHNMKTKRW